MPKQRHKQKEKAPAPVQPLLIAMPLFTNGSSYDPDKLKAHLEQHWRLKVTSAATDGDTAMLTVDGNTVAIAYVPVALPQQELAGMADYAYNWPDAIEALAQHSGHAIVTVLPGSRPVTDRYRLLVKILHSILSVSDAAGVYQGSQFLLLSREEYLDSAAELHDGELPAHLCVYIGMYRGETGYSSYTQGMQTFGMQEMEIIDARQDMDTVYDFMYDVCSYAIAGNVSLSSGDTFGYTEEQEVQITAAPGQFVNGQVLRLEL